MRRVRQWEPQQRRELWARWKAGESVVEIAKAIGRVPTSVYGFLERHGGVAPAVRKRSALALKLEEREEISRALALGESLRSIARGLQRSASTISREVRRHGGVCSYRACEADRYFASKS